MDPSNTSSGVGHAGVSESNGKPNGIQLFEQATGKHNPKINLRNEHEIEDDDDDMMYGDEQFDDDDEDIRGFNMVEMPIPVTDGIFVN